MNNIMNNIVGLFQLIKQVNNVSNFSHVGGTFSIIFHGFMGIIKGIPEDFEHFERIIEELSNYYLIIVEELLNIPQ